MRPACQPPAPPPPPPSPGILPRVARGPWTAGAVALGALLLALALPRAAAAQTPDAEGLFRQGVQAARDGRWPDALEAFTRSYDLSPRPLTLMNLAGAQARTGRLIEAAEAYRRFLVEATDERTRTYREPVSRALRDVEARMPYVRLEIAGLLPADRVTIDERAFVAGQVSGELPVNPGEHRVVVRRGTEPPMIVGRAQFSVSEGQHTRVAVPLGPPEPDPAAAVVAPPAAPVPSPREVARRDDARPRPRRDPGAPRRVHDEGGGGVLASPVFWVVVGLVVAGGATAGVLLATSGGSPDPIPGNTTPGVLEVE